jgi:hypothetical protein
MIIVIMFFINIKLLIITRSFEQIVFKLYNIKHYFLKVKDFDFTEVY